MSRKSRNWHDKHEETLTRGDRIADSVAAFIGSWKGIIISNCIVVVWIAFNVLTIFGFKWDPYPFILLNLVFSWQAYNSAPLIMMAQNRAAAKDKIQAEHEYKHQESELKFNTEITQDMHDLIKEMHPIITGKEEDEE